MAGRTYRRRPVTVIDDLLGALSLMALKSLLPLSFRETRASLLTGIEDEPLILCKKEP